MNYIVKEAADLVAKMSPTTLEAYKGSTGVDIAETILKIQRKVVRWQWIFFAISIISIALALYSLMGMMPPRSVSPKHLIIFLSSLSSFPISILFAFMCETWWTREIEEFYENTRGLLLISKAPCLLSFEEQMKRTLLETAIHLVAAEREFSSILEWPNVSPTDTRNIADNEIDCRLRLFKLRGKASLFGYGETPGRLMERAMKSQRVTD